jgi:hypothetical protein
MERKREWSVCVESVGSVKLWLEGKKETAVNRDFFLSESEVR